MNPAALLPALDLLVLARVDPGRFRTVVAPPPWAGAVFPGLAGAEAYALGEAQPFLLGFLDEAEEAWEAGGEPPRSSGIWMAAGPEGEELPLEASARYLEGEPVVVVQGLQAVFPEQERMLQLARERMLESERLRQEVERKEVLVHCVVHDMSGPLGSLKMLLDMLADPAEAAEHPRYLELARAQVQRQVELTQDVLEAYKAETAALQAGAGEALDAEALRACLAGVREDLGAALEQRGLALEVVEGEGLPPRVRGTASRLRRVLFNFGDNAQRNAPRGSRLRITLDATPDGDLEVGFEDEGPGLEPDAEHQIFQRMRQGRGGRGKLGLGLYYCRITARSWGGEVGCGNRPEGGARFWIRLPAA